VWKGVVLAGWNDLQLSLRTSRSHAHKFYDWQTIPGVDGFADSMSVRGLPRMVSFLSFLLFVCLEACQFFV